MNNEGTPPELKSVPSELPFPTEGYKLVHSVEDWLTYRIVKEDYEPLQTALKELEEAKEHKEREWLGGSIDHIISSIKMIIGELQNR